MKFTVLSYNPSRHFSWAMHRTGCADINKELKGIHTDSGFPAEFCENIEAGNYQEAADKFLAGANADFGPDEGYGIEAIRIAPCCHDKPETESGNRYYQDGVKVLPEVR